MCLGSRSSERETNVLLAPSATSGGFNGSKGIRFEGLTPRIVDLEESGISVNDLWIHDEHDKTKANILSRFYDLTDGIHHFPRPFGVFYSESKPTYEEELNEQIKDLTARKGRPSLDKILSGDKTWTIL
ncbi:MAG: hypothetical protein EBZ77_04495 [Chitinophagia bacterium]|nr:hypothetical protein [Chitinophagia bacterium]